MADSHALLIAYAQNGCESAFRDLVTRYIDLVYSTALRQVGGDAHLAQDVAQTVFLHLAKKAGRMPRSVLLGGWLHQATCNVAATVTRAERRRHLRERQAVQMNTLQNDATGRLEHVTPILDEAINQLAPEDRAAVVLRFFEKRDFRAVGAALGSSEDAARMRVNRALEKLGLLLKQRGVTTSAAALGAALTAEAVSAAPAGLAASAAGAALAGAAAAGGAILPLLKVMTLTKLQIGISALIVAGAATTLVIQHQAQLKLGEDNQALRQQIAQLQTELQAHKPHLAVPPKQVTASVVVPPAEDLPVTKLPDRSLKNGPIKLTREQIDGYLKANGRNAATLLTAFRASDDPTLLQEAMENFPKDPRVDLAAIFKPGSSPQEQRQWLNAFEQSAPDNSLANYVSALNYFQSGQTDQAVHELNTATSKAQFLNYRQESMQSDVEAYLAAGFPMADAKVVGPTINPQIPMNSALRQLGQDMVGLATGYQQSGDPTSAQAALQMAVNLGQRLNAPDGPTAVGILVGMNIESIAFSAMDPASPFGDGGQTVQDQMNQLAQQRTALMELGKQFSSFAPTMSDQDWINYRDREWAFGQTIAQQWAISKYGQH